MESFLYGIGPEYEREDGIIGGNTRQLYIWSEPLDYKRYFKQEQQTETMGHPSDLIFNKIK